MNELLNSIGCDAEYIPQTDDILAALIQDIDNLLWPQHAPVVIKKYYGIGCASSTMQEIGEELGISRSRVARIREKAVRMLKHHSRLIALSAAIEHVIWGKRGGDPRIRGLHDEIEKLKREVGKLTEQLMRQEWFEKEPIIRQPVVELFNARVAECLKIQGIITVGDLIRCTEVELLQMPNLGRKSLNEIREVLACYGLRLGWR